VVIFINDSFSPASSIVRSTDNNAPSVPPSEIVVLDKRLIRIVRVTGRGIVGADGGTKPTWPDLGLTTPLYKGTWTAATNTPTLADGAGTAGWYYPCTGAGTVNFGAGNITFAAGDGVYYTGSVWAKATGYTCKLALGLAGATGFLTDSSIPPVVGTVATGLMGWEQVIDFSAAGVTGFIGALETIKAKLMVQICDAAETRTICLQDVLLLNPVK
jgi:hypothetical protein